MQSYVSDFLLSILSPLLLGLAALLVARIELWIRTHVKQTELQSLLLRATEAASVAANETAQTLVDNLKLASADGTLTADEASRALISAKARARMYLGPDGLALARRVLGNDESAIDAWLTGLIEREVRRVRELGV
jgi:hypothetical protein